jgi:hypothetical protein
MNYGRVEGVLPLGGGVFALDDGSSDQPGWRRGALVA